MSDKTLSAQEFLQGKYPQMRGEKWNSNENINDNWIAEMMEEYASQQTSTLRKEIEGLTRAYNQCSESHRRSVDSHCIEKELLQKEIEDLKEQNEKMREQFRKTLVNLEELIALCLDREITDVETDGNRELWGDEHKITAIEFNPKVADEYKRRFRES